MTTDTRKVQLEITADATGVKTGTDQAGAAVRELGRDVQAAGAQAAQGLDNIGAGATRAAQDTDRATQRLINSIQRTTAAAQAGGSGTAAYFDAIASQRGLNADALRPYVEKLREVELAQAATGKAMGSTAISAGQMQAALRNVPAQFTDIATSLASGQQPLTVFLQQGGQLKDMFGGIGPAARALGGYVAGLINPFTVAAAAAGTLFVAYKAGADEITRLQQASILAGQQMGQTASQLQDIAQAVSAAGAGSFGAAAEFIGQIAASGRIAAADIAKFTDVALRMERVGGPAAKETAKAFAELGKDPLQASIKLTDQYNYLTAATYQQIKALEDQGRKTEAASLAQREFADGMAQRLPQMEASLGFLTRGWNTVRDAIVGAWGALKNIGREETAAIQSQSLSAQSAALTQSLEKMTGISGSDQRARALIQSQLEGIKARQAALQETVRMEQKSADLNAQRAAAVEAAVGWDKQGQSYLSKRVQMEREIAQARQIGAAAGKSEAEIASRVAAIQAKYTDKSPSGAARRPLVNPVDVEALRSYAKAMDDLERISQNAAANADQLSKSQAKLREVQASPTWAQYSRQQQEQIIYAASQSQAQEDLAESHKTLMRITGEARRDYEKWLETVAKGGEQASQQAQRLRDEAEAAALVVPGYRSLEQAIVLVEIARLRERQTAMLGNEDAVKALQAEIDKRQELVGLIGQADRRKDAETAAKRYAEERQREQEKIGDALTDALMSAFDKGKSFAQSFRDTVVNMFKTMVLKPIVQAIVNPVAAVVAGGLGIGGAAYAGTSGAAQAAGVLDSAKNLYSSLQGSFTGIGTSVALAADKLGEWLVTNTTGILNKAGGTLLQNAGAIGSIAESVSGAMAGLGLRSAIGGKFEISSGYSTFQQIGVLAATAIGGPVLGAIAGAAAGLINRAFGRGPKEAQAQGIVGSFGGGDATGQAFADWRQKGGWFRSDKSGTDLSPLSTELGAALDAGAAAMLAQTKAYAQTLALPADILSSISSDFRIQFTQDAEANKQAIADAVTAYGQSLSAGFTRALSPFQKAGEQLQDTLGRLATLQVFSTNLNALGGVFSRVAGLSVDAREGFIAMVGGMETLAQQAQGFVQNFYSRDEIAGLKAAELQTVLAAAGVNAGGIGSKEDFRALVDQADVTTEAGRQQLAALLSASAAFVDVADYMATAGVNLAQVASQAPASGALANILNPSAEDVASMQVDATHGVTAAVDRVADQIMTLIEVTRNQQEQLRLWAQEVGGGA